MALPDCFDCKFAEAGHPCRTADGAFDFAKAAAAHVARGRIFGADGDEPDPAILDTTAWITDCEYELLQDYPDLILPLAVAAIDACETPEDAAYVAAGLIEDALAKHGSKLIIGFEELAAAHAKVRYVLSGVWSHGGSIDAGVWSRLGKAIGAGPRMSDDGRSSYDGSAFTVLDETEALALLREPILRS